MRNVRDKKVAERLMAIITPGDDSITGMIRAGEEIPAVVTLVEMAAQARKPIPDELRSAVQCMVDEDAFDAEERCTVVEDLATLAHLAASRM
jgi:hypothetical protein